MVDRVERTEDPEAATKDRHVIEVDQPHRCRYAKPWLHALGAAVGDPGAVARRAVTTRPPSEAAARTPERHPSSWKPHPWYAPANAMRPSFSRGSEAWAATESAVYTGCEYRIRARTRVDRALAHRGSA